MDAGLGQSFNDTLGVLVIAKRTGKPCLCAKPRDGYCGIGRQPPPVIRTSYVGALVLGVGNCSTRKIKSTTAMPAQRTTGRRVGRSFSAPAAVGSGISFKRAHLSDLFRGKWLRSCPFGGYRHDASVSSKALASFRSRVLKPSVNQL